MVEERGIGLTLNDIKFLVYLVNKRRIPISLEKIAKEIGIAENTLRYYVIDRCLSSGYLGMRHKGRLILESGKSCDITGKGRELVRQLFGRAVDVSTVMISLILGVICGIMAATVLFLTLGNIIKVFIVVIVFLFPSIGLIAYSMIARERYIRRFLRLNI